MHALGREASRLAWGDFEAIRQPVGGIVEIHELQRTLREMAGQIRRSQAAMQDHIAALTEMQENERKRLARELHDETVQSLIALSQRITMLELDMAEAARGSNPAGALPQARDCLSELTEMLNRMLAEIRSLIRDLPPIYLEELGVVAAVEMPSDLAAEGHFRLLGMYERATRLGGHFSVRSAPGTGTRIIAFLPG